MKGKCIQEYKKVFIQIKFCENEHNSASKSVEKLYSSSLIIQNIKISIFKKNGVNK